MFLRLWFFFKRLDASNHECQQGLQYDRMWCYLTRAVFWGKLNYKLLFRHMRHVTVPIEDEFCHLISLKYCLLRVLSQFVIVFVLGTYRLHGAAHTYMYMYIPLVNLAKFCPMSLAWHQFSKLIAGGWHTYCFYAYVTRAGVGVLGTRIWHLCIPKISAFWIFDPACLYIKKASRNEKREQLLMTCLWYLIDVNYSRHHIFTLKLPPSNESRRVRGGTCSLEN